MNLPITNRKPGFDVNLGENKPLKSFPARTLSADKIEIDHIIDYYADKKVIAFTKSVLGRITLWEGDAYDAIGQWTDQDVTDRIIEIVNNI
jgi:hypothetical protein